MTQLINFINNLNEAKVTWTNKYQYGYETTSLRKLKEIVNYENGSLVKNYSLNSGRILAAGKLYKIVLYEKV